MVTFSRTEYYATKYIIKIYDTFMCGVFLGAVCRYYILVSCGIFCWVGKRYYAVQSCKW